MKLSKFGRIVWALVASASLGLGMTACGGGTIGYMWVLGTQYNQISAFKIDNYTGNLTQSPHSPFSSGGTNPQALVVKAGGRFVYVINTGVPATIVAGKPTTSTPGSIAEFSVGGDGVLIYQQSFSSQGTTPVWAAMDPSGNFLYVLDKYSPAYNGTTDLNGSVTVFAIDGGTGRLTLITNQGQPVSGTPPTLLTYFEVGPSPTMLKLSSSGCMYALSPTTIYPLSVNSSNGQLTVPTTGTYVVPGAGNLSSINTGGSYIYVTDSANNVIYPLQGTSAGCALSPVSPSTVTNLPLTSHPVNSITSTNGKFLYVINQSATSNPNVPSNSTISAFTIDTNGTLLPLSDIANPYATGSGPVCVVQDPSSQYLFTSNNTDSTVTGKVINQNTGIISDLGRGSVFPVTGRPSCLAISGSI